MTVTADRPARATSPVRREATRVDPVRARPPRSITRRRRQPWVSTVDAVPAAPGPAAALPRAPFVILVLVLVIVGVLGVLVLNTKINEGAFRIDDLDTKQNSLDTQQQELERQLADKQAPANLDSAAQGLGLVPAGQPGFVNPDGTVVGTPQPAQATGGLASGEQGGQ